MLQIAQTVRTPSGRVIFRNTGTRIPGILVANTPLWIAYPYCYSGYLVSCSLVADRPNCAYTIRQGDFQEHRDKCCQWQQADNQRGQTELLQTVISVALVLMMLGIVALALVLNFLQ